VPYLRAIPFVSKCDRNRSISFFTEIPQVCIGFRVTD
jgi:hypothetical protein